MGASDLSAHDAGLGAASGLVTSIAFLAFYTAVAHGRMGIVVPVSAAMAALLPAVVGIAGGNNLSRLAIAGVLCALVSIPLVAYEPEDSEGVTKHDAPERWSRQRQVVISSLCGGGFGIYFVCIGHTSTSSGLWPTVANLVVASAVTIAVASPFFTRSTARLTDESFFRRTASTAPSLISTTCVACTISMRRSLQRCCFSSFSMRGLSPTRNSLAI